MLVVIGTLLLGLSVSAPALASREPELVRPKKSKLFKPEPELVRPAPNGAAKGAKGTAKRSKSAVGPPPPLGSEMRTLIRDAALRASLDPKLVEAVVHVESRGRSNAVSPKGAMGMMQVMPRTADSVEIHDPFNPMNNLMGACDYLRQLLNRYRGNLRFALAAYNAGPANVDRYGGVPPFDETQHYVDIVMGFYRNLKR